jgi:hypothetical protein
LPDAFIVIRPGYNSSEASLGDSKSQHPMITKVNIAEIHQTPDTFINIRSAF